MSDLLHTHLTLGFRPVGKCAACDQTRRDFGRIAAHCSDAVGNRASSPRTLNPVAV